MWGRYPLADPEPNRTDLPSNPKAKRPMDQLKDILKQAIKYRFWIAVGVSALLPMIAYFVGVGAVQAEAAKQTGAITSAEKDVKQYASGNVINDQYKPIVAEKTAELTTDVNASWKKL